MKTKKEIVVAINVTTENVNMIEARLKELGFNFSKEQLEAAITKWFATRNWTYDRDGRLSSTGEIEENTAFIVEYLFEQLDPVDQELILKQLKGKYDTGCWTVFIDIDNEDIRDMDFNEDLQEIANLITEGKV